MGKITKILQTKHKETLSPWLKDFVESTSTTPLPLLPQRLKTFPSRWPFGRGDLYHWIPLLNRFDTILESFCKLYKLNDGPQQSDFGCGLLNDQDNAAAGEGGKRWSVEDLRQLGYMEDGDRTLIESILSFTCLLLEHCGNRSIYASSSHLNDLLNSTSLSVLIATLEVGSELAQRYQASVKRIGHASRHISAALLANHYNIDIERVQQIAHVFIKTPIISLADPAPSVTPASGSKGKEKVQAVRSKDAVATHANDLVSLATSNTESWNGWGDIKVFYYPQEAAAAPEASAEKGSASLPSTPTPLRRSTTVGAPQQTPKNRNAAGDESSPVWPRTPGIANDHSLSGQKCFELPQSVVLSHPIHELMERCPQDMPPVSKYEVFHRLRVARALLGDMNSRQQILASRLLATTNLAYIHNESNFVEKVLRNDMDEARRYQLVYQLADLIHPSTEQETEVPLWLQTISLALLEAISGFHARCQDVLSALNANVNHGVLLYVIRKAVAGMEDDEHGDDGNQVNEKDDWRNNLFSLTLNICMATRIGSEMASAGLMEILVQILNMRTQIAQRHHSMVLAFLDGLIWAFPNAFSAFFNADGLDAVSKLVVDTVAEATALVQQGKGISASQQSSAVDYTVPYYQQQTLKWLLKFVHRIMSNTYSYNGNTDRMLRNLSEKSDLLAGLRHIIRDKRSFGSVVWTNCVMILSDFINNDPTSFAAISESGMISTYLEAITGRDLPVVKADETKPGDAENDEESDSADSSAISAMIEQDERPHPPSEEALRATERQVELATGIMASSDAINAIPQVLNSICLNKLGMKMVVASRAFDSFFEVFESARHVKCMESDGDLAGTVGGNFDELARHHPPLRTAISNSVIDMVARVRLFAMRKSEVERWGAKLLLTSESGAVVSVTADGHIEESGEDSHGFSTRTSGDGDVQMSDSSAVARVESSDKQTESQGDSPYDSISPYVFALATFLSAYLSNSVLKANFIEKGGLELLLDICESPSLPATYGDSPASRVMASVVSLLIEHSPVRGLPSLLTRAQSSINDLQPLADKTEALPPIFGPFLSADLRVSSSNVSDTLLSGNKMVKSLLNAQTFIKIISDCFAATRANSIQFFPVNVYDYYLALVKSIGPLMRGVLAEEAGELSLVPQKWSLRNRDALGDASRQESTANRIGEESSLPDVMTSTGSWRTTDESAGENHPTDEERATARYKNYEVLKMLLHPMIPTSFPFFQSLGKALIPRREQLHGDPFPRPRHLEIAKALADTVLDQLAPSVATSNPTSKEFHYWIITLHTIHEMLIDHPTGRQSDRSNIQILMPVLLAFKEQGGLDVLNDMLQAFVNAVQTGAKTSPEETSNSKVAAFGLKKVLDLYAILANGKYITETSNHFNLQRQMERSQTVPHVFQQIVVDIRAAILPKLLLLWNSDVFEHVPVQTIKRLVDILKLIAASENEPPSSSKDRASFKLLKYTDARFNWRNSRSVVHEITNAGYDESLAYEATYRANGNSNMAREYCRAHKAGLAGPSNPIPPQDIDKLAASPQNQDTEATGNSEADRMSIDAVTDAGSELTGEQPQAVARTSSSGSLSSESEHSGSVASNAQRAGDSTSAQVELDNMRVQLRDNLIDQCLDAIRAHPECAIEVSELINTVILRSQNHEAQEDVGATLTFALSSLALDEEERKRNGKCIAAYSHLLALLLQDESFFTNNIDSLRDKSEEYLAFLKIPSSTGDEMPPWIPYILLILEIFLCHDERPIAAQWKPPKSIDEEVAEPIVQLETSLVDDEQRATMLEYLLDLLPRIGKDELLATSILRILVILTRKRQLSKHVGEKRNLQRLFLMAKQLSGFGSERLKQNRLTAYIITILRHIVEDEETVKQVMRAEIMAEYPNLTRSNRGHLDVTSYLRAMAPVALRAPEFFVQVTNELMRFSRWSADGSRPNSLLLKEGLGVASSDGQTTPRLLDDAGHASTEEVKPSTELSDKEMIDAPKSSESKRPVVENPDAVIHFLLCELVNYREVDDKEAVSSTKDAKSNAESPAPEGSDEAPSSDSNDDNDKKQTKPVFKAEEHPIFVYRCFLLNCLTELLQSYTRAKVEFINFKRSAPPLSSNTPIKPRTGILNYLIYDLLCQSNLSGTADTIVAKKKAATSAQTQKVLVALVSRASEKPATRNQNKFEYDDDADLLFVRKFVLDTILRAYEKAPISDEPFETRYSRMQCLAELMNHMVGDKDKEQRPQDRFAEVAFAQSQAQLRRLMYEKGYLDKLTGSIAEVNLNYPGVKRAIKYVLRVLRILTDTAKELSHSNLLKSEPQGEAGDEEFDSASSLSDLDDDREETPDLYRNSALGMLEPRDEDDDYDDEDEDEEGMYGDEYDEEMDYGDEDMSDGEDAISDDDEEEFGEMGQIEGLHGEPGVVEVIMDDDDDEDDDDDSDEDEDDSADSADMEDIDDRVEIVDEEGHPIEDDSAWESDSDIEEVIEPEVDDLEYEGEMPGDHEGGIDMGADDLIGNMARAIMGDDEYDGDLMGGLDEHYLDDDDHDDGEEDDEEEIEDDEYLDDEHFPQDHVPTLPSLGWDGMNADHDERHRQLFLLDGQRRPVFTRMEHRGGFPSRFIGGAHRDHNGDFRNYFARNHRGGGQQSQNEDGVNPLLRRNDVANEGTPRPGQSNTFGFRLPEGLLGGGGRHVIDGPMGFLGELMEFLPMMGRNGQPTPSFHVHISGPGGAQTAFPLRASRSDQRRDASQEPHQAVSFSAESTIHRYQEEARMLFGANHIVEALKLTNAINAELTPAGIELEKKLRITEEQNRKRLEEVRKKKEEEERQAREAKEAEEKAAREKKEAEEREAAERAATEAANQSHDEVVAQAGSKDEDSAMEGVEASETNQDATANPDAPRIMTTLRGSEYDITDLGIDPDYLAALPEEFREEVIAQTLTERRSQAREEATTAGESTEVFQEFLDALPEELRVEIAQQEQQEQRRRHRDESRRQAAASASADQAAIPTDMDTASILLTFPPELREQVLLEQGQDLMDQLPPDMAAHARALAQQHSPMPVQRATRTMPPPGAVQPGSQRTDAEKTVENKPQRKTVVQMLDKAGVATLLRLMFIAQQGSIRNYLFGVFADVCENRQNRLEVVSTVLQILQEGTTDMPAVERSFGQLSIKARRHKEKETEPRTPQNLKRTLTALTITNNAQTNSETSPLLIAQQCLDLLVDLCARNPHTAWVFLTEHDIVGATIRKVLNRKGKSKDSKAQKYAINALLTLLDRELVTESSVVMTHLADLLNRVTMPLQNLERRRKESKSEGEGIAEQSQEQASGPTGSNAAADSASGAAEQGEAAELERSTEEQGTAQKRTRQLQPPLIPEESLALVVRIFVARECSSKTFQNTIATIKNLCAIPGTKAIFGQELIRQARLLSENIVSDLDDLLPHITEASSGTDIQGVALSKFSPGASEQNKLLRVLTALDHLFDTKKKNGDAAAEQTSESERDDLLISLYHNSTFSAMWEKLSTCLRAIRLRENMLNVATILLPLIESLMVVCKNTTSKEDLSQSKELTMSSPHPESQTASLFYSFTEEHRRILNELVRHSPKLMSGTFALLVKNPKVLEFDNKRNYFNRSVHSRAGQNHGRQSYPSLQLSIRRDHVFHDSYKSLYFKSGDEVKFGKLSIRFHGEEGVDAGGVTREWFQVLARQMFDPNYVLFTPVSSDRTTFHPNKLSGVNEEHLSFFKFIGRIIGKALYEGRLLDCFFSRAVYKRILGKAVSVKDMESFDPDYYKSLCWMLDNDITDIITETFSVEDEEFGVAKVVDLKPNGRDIAVTEENKHEYVRLMVDHKLLSSVKEQMESFLTGFHEIIPAELISIFNEQELELLISGLPDIDIDDWRGNTEYQNYSPSSSQIQWFWRAVRSFDKEELAKLLQFVTGTSKVPLNGFKELEGMNGVSRFNIHRDYGNKDRLPTSHTCFNQLDLPEYDSYDLLRAQLLKAITQGSEYFGFA